jgi:hypothetical protein
MVSIILTAMLPIVFVAFLGWLAISGALGIASTL